MRTITTLMIEAGETPRASVKATSKESAIVSIHAGSLEEAVALANKCDPEDACRNWTPAPADPAPAAPAVVTDEKTARRFERAAAFSKKNNSYLSTTDFLYCKRMGTADGLVAMFDLAYMKGYEAARRRRAK